MEIGRGGLYLRGVSHRALVLYLRLCADADAQGRGTWSEHIRAGLGERHTVDRCVRELERAHYLERQQGRQGAGRFARASYRVIIPAAMTAPSGDDMRTANERSERWVASPARAELAGHSPDCTDVLDGVAGELDTEVVELVARRCLAACVASAPVSLPAQVARVTDILLRMRDTRGGIRSPRGAVEHAWTQVCGSRTVVADRGDERRGDDTGDGMSDPNRASAAARPPFSAEVLQELIDGLTAFARGGTEAEPGDSCPSAAGADAAHRAGREHLADPGGRASHEG